MIIDAETVTKCIHTKLTIQWSVLVSPCTDTMLSIASCQAQLRDNLKESRDSMPAAETQSRRVNQSPRLLIIQRWRLRCCRGERPRPSRVESSRCSAPRRAAPPRTRTAGQQHRPLPAAAAAAELLPPHTHTQPSQCSRKSTPPPAPPSFTPN